MGIAFFSVACGGSVAAQPSSAGDAQAPFDARTEASIDSATPTIDSGLPTVDAAFDARDPAQCAGGGTLTFDDSCTTDADCVVVTVYVGCCRSDALGCNVSGVASLVDAGAACGNLDPCDCAGNVVIADDGKVSKAPHQTDVTVSCVAGVCLTRVK
jgi:hypothetical protein